MSAQTTQPFEAREASTAKLTATIQDESEAVIPAAQLSTLRLTLYDQATELADPDSTAAIINSRTAQNILNANGCTVSTGGVMTLTLTPADNIIVDATKSSERHVALIEYTYAAGLKAGKEEILIDVLNYSRTS